MALDPTPDPPASEQGDSPEERERAAAWQRGAERARTRETQDARHRDEPERSALAGRTRVSVAARAFAALAENVRDYAIFLMDPNGVITFWGEGARLVKGWSKDEAEGAHLRLLYPPGGSDDGTAQAHLDDAARDGEYTGEGLRIRRDGSTFWAGVTITALWDDTGTLLGFAKVTRDLTARRAADVLLQGAAAASEAARADAVAASTAKNGFLATMSHEIRTPVNAILGYNELLELEIDGPLTPGQRRHLARAGASARHLLALISEVLDFSRIESEHVAVARSAFRIGDVVSAALSLVAPQARTRGLTLVDRTSGFAAALTAWGDEARARQILVNLFANAVKFTAPRDGEPGRITVSAGAAVEPSPDVQLVGDGPYVYVQVEDTGPGIAPELLQPIFEAFVQADATLTRRHGGTGLGLAISRRLARLMGGDVVAHSQVGVGSTFVLWLPAAPLEALQAGGLVGSGPERESTEAAPPEVRSSAAELAAEGHEPPGRALRAVADAVLQELEALLHTYAVRLRHDPVTVSAHDAPTEELEDHLATFLADLAGMLYQASAAEGVAPGTPSPNVRDSLAIQRVVAERHGAQRARLGWREHEVRREFVILREELTAAVRRAAPRHLHAPTLTAWQREIDLALDALAPLLVFAEEVSLASHAAAIGSE